MNICGFGGISLKGLFEPVWPFGTDIRMRIFYAASDDTESVICALDTSDTFFRETARFRELVGALTGIPADNIWYHELQLHAAPASLQLRGDTMRAIAEAAAREIDRIRAHAVPYTCEAALCDMGMEYSFNREQYVEGLGGVTVWSGMRFDEAGRAYITDPDRMLLKGYRPDLPVFDQPIWFDNPVDPCGYLFVFYGSDGSVLGTLSRFAAHPDVAVLFELRGDHAGEYRYNWDWPGYLCARLEEVFDAPAVYLNGPCADLSVKKGFDGMDDYASADGECRRIGTAIADRLVSGFRTSRIALGEEGIKAKLLSVRVPIREDYPKSVGEAHDMHADMVARAGKARDEAIARGAAPWLVKRFTDDLWRAERTTRFIDTVAGLEDEDLARRTVPCMIPCLRIGKFVLIGVPGECLTAVSACLRSMFTGFYTVPVDQVNGYYGYMATPASLTLGGYTYWESWIARQGIPVMLRAIREGLWDLVFDGQ